MRAFLAVPADPAWVSSTAELVAPLRAELPRASWTRPEAWHLTLKFLGEISEDAAERFAGEIAPFAADMPPGGLASSGALVLPPRGRPRVLAAGFAPSDASAALEALAGRADGAASRIGVAPEPRPFRPHVTLARLREPWRAASVAAFRSAVDGAALPAFHLRECILFQSRLHPSGAIHTPVRRFAFAAAREEVRA